MTDGRLYHTARNIWLFAPNTVTGEHEMAIAYYNSASMEWEVLDLETEEVLDSFEDRSAALEYAAILNSY